MKFHQRKKKIRHLFNVPSWQEIPGLDCASVWFFLRCQLQSSAELCTQRHHLREMFRRRNLCSLHRYSMSLRTRTTVSLTGILMSQRTPNLLDNHKLRESHRLSLLSQLVQANVEGFARCHEDCWVYRARSVDKHRCQLEHYDRSALAGIYVYLQKRRTRFSQCPDVPYYS